MTAPLDYQVLATLVDQQLYKSALALGALCVARADAEPDAALAAAVYRLYGRACAHDNQHLRANFYFEKALLRCSNSNITSFHSFDTCASTSAAPSDYTQTKLLQFASLLHSSRYDAQEALSVFQSVNQPDAHLPAWAWLRAAEAYRFVRDPLNARQCCMHALALQPHALYAVQMLAQLDASLADLNQVCASAHSVVLAVASALLCTWRFEFAAACKAWTELLERYATCTFVLRCAAVAYVKNGEAAAAEQLFRRLRLADPYCLDAMDTYGSIIKVRGALLDLRVLARDAFAIDRKRPETWCLAALVAESVPRYERALAHCEQAIVINPMHNFAYLMRGTLLLATKDARAVAAFHDALALGNDLSAFQGLVQAHMIAGNNTAALNAARSAYQRMPRNARALSLLGMVLACHAPRRRRARQLLEQALALRADCIEAVLCLSDLDMAEDQVDDAVQRLKRHIANSPAHREFLYNKLGDVLFFAEKPNEAKAQYLLAREINPHSRVAERGLEQAEDALRRLADATQDSQHAANNTSNSSQVIGVSPERGESLHVDDLDSGWF